MRELIDKIRCGRSERVSQHREQERPDQEEWAPVDPDEGVGDGTAVKPCQRGEDKHGLDSLVAHLDSVRLDSGVDAGMTKPRPFEERAEFIGSVQLHVRRLDEPDYPVGEPDDGIV